MNFIFTLKCIRGLSHNIKSAYSTHYSRSIWFFSTLHFPVHSTKNTNFTAGLRYFMLTHHTREYHTYHIHVSLIKTKFIHTASSGSNTAYVTNHFIHQFSFIMATTYNRLALCTGFRRRLYVVTLCCDVCIYVSTPAQTVRSWELIFFFFFVCI